MKQPTTASSTIVTTQIMKTNLRKKYCNNYAIGSPNTMTSFLKVNIAPSTEASITSQVVRLHGRATIPRASALAWNKN
jgi:hypothetical protein